MNKILKENYRNITSAENMKESIIQQDMAQLDLIEDHLDTIAFKSFNKQETIFNYWQQNAYTTISLPRELIILDSIKTQYNNYISRSDTLQNLLLLKTNYIETKTYHLKKIMPVTRRLINLCNSLKEINETAIYNAESKSDQISKNAYVLISLFSILAIILSILTGFFFTKKVLQPVRKTAESVRKISRGHFSHKIPITTNDEIAELGMEFNSMTNRINKYIQDVTGLKELDKLKSQFMANVSHEFKTPLTSMNMAIDILLKEVKGAINQEQKSILQDTKDDLSRLTEFAKEILTLAKLESGSKQFNFVEILIRDLLDYALLPLRFKLSEKSIQLSIIMQPNSSRTQADFKQLSRVITNVVDNAIRYTPINGLIKISTHQNSNRILFCIEDNGIGIPEGSIDTVFDKFTQVQKDNSDEENNIGLGLAIAKEIVELHRGEIWVESKENLGSKFYISIPV